MRGGRGAFWGDFNRFWGIWGISDNRRDWFWGHLGYFGVVSGLFWGYFGVICLILRLILVTLGGLLGVILGLFLRFLGLFWSFE